MTRIRLDDMTSQQLDDLYQRAEEDAAALDRVRALADRWSNAAKERPEAVIVVGVASDVLQASLAAPTPGIDAASDTAQQAAPAPAATGLRGLLDHVGIGTTGRDITVDGRVVDPASAATEATEAPPFPRHMQVWPMDFSHTKWAWRCWGTDTCDGWCSLHHHSEDAAVQGARQHLAEAHAPAATEAASAMTHPCTGVELGVAHAPHTVGPDHTRIHCPGHQSPA